MERQWKRNLSVTCHKKASKIRAIKLNLIGMKRFKMKAENKVPLWSERDGGEVLITVCTSWQHRVHPPLSLRLTLPSPSSLLSLPSLSLPSSLRLFDADRYARGFAPRWWAASWWHWLSETSASGTCRGESTAITSLTGGFSKSIRPQSISSSASEQPVWISTSVVASASTLW